MKSLLLVAGTAVLTAPLINAQQSHPVMVTRDHPALATSAAMGDDRQVGRDYSYWTFFQHPRFQFEVPVPPGMRAIGNPESGSSATFESLDGLVTMKVWGGRSATPGVAVFDNEWKEARQRAGRTVTWERKGRNSFVVAGVSSNRELFYEKFIMRGDHVASMTVTWPGSDSGRFAYELEEVVLGFTLVDDPDRLPEKSPVLLTKTPSHEVEAITLEEWRQADLIPSGTAAPAPLPGVMWQGTRSAASRTMESEQKTETRRELTTPDITPPEPVKEVKPQAADLPVGTAVPGRDGFVYSPYVTEKKLVDAVGIASGTKVKCPYTGKAFRVP